MKKSHQKGAVICPQQACANNLMSFAAVEMRMGSIGKDIELFAPKFVLYQFEFIMMDYKLLNPLLGVLSKNRNPSYLIEIGIICIKDKK